MSKHLNPKNRNPKKTIKNQNVFCLSVAFMINPFGETIPS